MQTIDPQRDDIRSEIEEALKSLAERKGHEVSASIRPILFANLDRGRVQRFLEGEIYRVSEYVERVADIYRNLSPLIDKLQSEKEAEVWKDLFKKLQVWAYNFLIRKNFTPNIATQEIAMECATEAAIAILDAYFPYDTDFEPWAHVVVQNTCRKFIRSATKKSVVPQQGIIELTETLSTVDDPILQNQMHQEDNNDILNAIAQLSGARRQVIELRYFEGLSPSEIAKRMDKSVDAINSLHFNAVQDLRKILGINRNNT